MQTLIQGVEAKWGSLSAEPVIYTMYIRWDEVDPMVLLYTFHKPGDPRPKAQDLWRIGRHQVTLAVINKKHMGMDTIRIGPLTESTTMLQQIYRYPEHRECFFSIPTEPLRHFLVRTLTKVSPMQEQQALETYLDNWLDRVLKAPNRKADDGGSN